MSRGPGRWQRLILERTDAGKAAILTGDNDTHSVQNAIRRAARSLEKAGRIKVTSVRIDGTPRLVAFPLAVNVPPPRLVTGLDGKTYRMPHN